MASIIYFKPGKNGRFINNGTVGKIIIGDHISKEGYYIGDTVEKEKCKIFYGKPYIPSEEEIPVPVQFNPNEHRASINQDSIEYCLVRHRQSGGYFVICRYMLNCTTIYTNKYRGLCFSDLLTFCDGKWQILHEPCETIKGQANAKIAVLWRKYGNYYEEDFEIIKKL